MNKQSSKVSDLPEKPMSLAEARKVMWLRNNYRPLGELLDEGFLDQKRLGWASEKAYDPKLKQAAKVLLDSLSHQTSAVTAIQNDQAMPELVSQTSAEATFSLDLTLEQARSTIWPFSPYKGQMMGPLTESRQISLKDLGFAIDTAWDERVRQAAIALLLVRLEQAVKEPASSAGFLTVTDAGRSYAVRQQFLLTFMQGVFLSAVFTTAIIGTIASFINLLTSKSEKPLSQALTSLSGLIALAILLGITIGIAWLIIYVLNQVMDRLDKRIKNYRKGQEGEDRVVEIMRQSLDGNWRLFRNVILSGRNKGDIDAILVGPSGVWVLEVKSYSGEYRNIGDQWEYRKGNRWKRAESNPGRQAEDNAIRLSNALKVDGIKQWVTGVVVWANPESPLTLQNPATTVWPLDRLTDELGNLWREPVPDAKREAITRKLTELCQQRSKSENNITLEKPEG